MDFRTPESTFILQDLFSTLYDTLPSPLSPSLSFTKPLFISHLLSVWNAQNPADTDWFRIMTLHPSARALIFNHLQAVISKCPYPAAILSRANELISMIASLETEAIENNRIRDMADEGLDTDEFLIDPARSVSPDLLEGASALRPEPECDSVDVKVESSAESVRNPLELIYRVDREGIEKVVKKEFFRVQHIRGMKKSIRQFRNGRTSERCIHGGERGTEDWGERKRRLRECFKKYRQELIQIADTTEGPATDGKTKRAARSPETQAVPSRSYNQAYCQQFFTPAYVREYFQLYCDVVYYGSPEEMCKRLGYRCCRGEGMHEERCESIWKSMHVYARDGLLQNLNFTT